MTPVQPGKSEAAKGTPAPDFPKKNPPKAKNDAAPADSYVPLSGDSDRYKTVEDLLTAIRDEALFGSSGNAVYQKERNKKYLKVTLALLEVRKYLRGDEKNSGVAAGKIETWLSDNELLTDKAVAHQARKNLIAALKRAPQGQGIEEGAKAMLASLQKNYSTQPPPPAAPPEKPKATEKPQTSLQDSLSDSQLFGDKLSDYNSKRTKEYLPVTLAILEIKKVARGDADNSDAAQAKVVSWLEIEKLLNDPVALQGRKALIKALQGQESLAPVLAALKANYSKAAPQPTVSIEREGSALKAVTVKPVSTPKSTREDDANNFQKGLDAAAKPFFQRVLKQYGSFSVKTTVTLSIDQRTGNIIQVSFSDLKISGDLSEQVTKELLTSIAESWRTKFNFKKTDNSDLAFIKAQVAFVAQK